MSFSEENGSPVRLDEENWSEVDEASFSQPEPAQRGIRMTAVNDSDEFNFETAPMPAAVLRSPARSENTMATPELGYPDEVVSPAKSLQHLGALVSPGQAYAEPGPSNGYMSPMTAEGESPKRMVRSESEIQYFDENARYLPSELANVVEYDEDIHHPVPVNGQAEILDFDSNHYFGDDDPANDPSDEEIDPDTVLADNSRTVGFGNIIQPTKVQFQAAEEPDEEISAMHPGAIFYPAPVPAQLRLPPLLSRRQNKAAQWRRKRSSRVFDAMMSDDHSVWGISPLTPELTTVRLAENGDLYDPDRHGHGDDDLDSIAPDSDSERATILSESNSYQDLGSIYGDGARADSKGGQFKRKGKFWMQKGWQSFTHKSGEPLEPGDEDDGIGAIDEEFLPKDDNDLAFTRYDKQVIDQHTKLFQSGGVYGNLRGSASTGENPPSLIEEIEIRRAGRKIQREVMVKESDMLETNRHGFMVHPVDQVHQPSLLELQVLAQNDYANRKEWHMEASNRVTNRAHPDETLKQRKQRIKNERSKSSVEAPQESLAARRARLRRSRPALPQTIHQTALAADAASIVTDSASMMSEPADTPALPHEDFDMVRAVALHM